LALSGITSTNSISARLASMDDEKFARYQEQIVEAVLENQRSAAYKGSKIHETTASTDRVRSSLSELRSSAIEARDKELNKYSYRRPVGKKVNSISTTVKPESRVFGYMRNDAGEIVPLNPYPPEPIGPQWNPAKTHQGPPSPEGLSPKELESYYKTRSQQLKDELRAAISSDPVVYKDSKASSGLTGVLSDVAAATSSSTKEKIAEDTLRAVEVVQSKKLGYAAVAAGAGALVLGMRNRRKSREEL